MRRIHAADLYFVQYAPSWRCIAKSNELEIDFHTRFFVKPIMRSSPHPVLCCLLILTVPIMSLQAQTLEAVSVFTVDDLLCETWPDPGVVAFRRTGIVGDLEVNFTLTGTALRDVDYGVPAGTTITIPAGEREAWLTRTPVNDTLTETTETISVTLLPGAGYAIPTLAAKQTAKLTIANGSLTKPGAKEAIRFLNQAAFGPSSDSLADVDIIPQNVHYLMANGFDAWIDGQFKTAVGLHQPTLDAMKRTRQDVYADAKTRAWWQRAIGPAAIDPLRQRVGFALSQIFVISDRVDSLSVQPIGMANYYDMLLTNAFGNARTLLLNVARHPCMGEYLSHLKNRKADPVAGTFPDENFAREIMQLFSIGLWELNADGTRRLDLSGQPIPTYDNSTITSFARVFTGLSFGGSTRTNFYYPPENYTSPMRMWDEFHDMEPKTLLNGVVLPARTASNPDRGTAGMLDVQGAVDCLFHHPNIGPFLGRQLIQRLITSNPSPEYVGRVAAKFANNGSGVRGDMRAVIKAILLDAEARSYSQLGSLSYGKLKEPYLRTVALARAFDARSASGIYELHYLDEIHAQQPQSNPSVFNFYRPSFSPAGPISDAGLVAPEFQILQAITSVSIPNYYANAIRNGFNRWGHSNPKYIVRAQLAPEKLLYNDVPALMRRLDLVLTGGTLDPIQHQNIREAVEAIDSTFWDWQNERLYLAIYLISTLPECAIQR
jgi:uncharacterized protein (DUF1800 family)